MIISYQGVESFKISHGDLTISVNPVSKDSKFKSSKFGADITLITTNHPDMNGRDETSRGDKQSFIVDGPGEYEIKDVVMKGFLSKSALGGKELFNTIYLISFEGMNLCFLGALSDPGLSSEVLEKIEGVDVLFVPIGGEGVLEPSEAYKLAVSFEPSAIIPMHYGQVGQKDALKMFLKEGGEEKVAPLDKLVVKKKDLEEMKGDIVVLKEE